MKHFIIKAFENLTQEKFFSPLENVLECKN